MTWVLYALIYIWADREFCASCCIIQKLNAACIIPHVLIDDKVRFFWGAFYIRNRFWYYYFLRNVPSGKFNFKLSVLSSSLSLFLSLVRSFFISINRNASFPFFFYYFPLQKALWLHICECSKSIPKNRKRHESEYKEYFYYICCVGSIWSISSLVFLLRGLFFFLLLFFLFISLFIVRTYFLS